MHESLFEYNFIDCPDLLPAVLVCCAALGVKARLRGIKNLRIKESDRMQGLKEELEKMGGHHDTDSHRGTPKHPRPYTPPYPSEPMATTA